VSGKFHAPFALPAGKNAGVRWTGVRIGFRAFLHGFGEERKSLAPTGFRSPDHLSCSL